MKLPLSFNQRTAMRLVRDQRNGATAAEVALAVFPHQDDKRGQVNARALLSTLDCYGLVVGQEAEVRGQGRRYILTQEGMDELSMAEIEGAMR